MAERRAALRIVCRAAGLIVGLGVRLDTAIEPAETLTWSWKGFGRWLPFGLPLGLAFGLVSVGLVSAGVEPGGALIGALVVALGNGLAFGLSGRLSGKQLAERLMLSPNEAIHRSFKNGLLISACWLGNGLICGLVGALVSGPGFGLIFGLSGMLGVLGAPEADKWVGLIGMLGSTRTDKRVVLLDKGLNAAVQHYMLRFWLAQSGVFPWKAVPFLEDATARILLRRVGGGYSFVHRLLLDYFADLDAQTPLARGAAQTKSTAVRTKAPTSADESCQ